MDRRFLGILTVIVIIFVGIFALNQRSNNGSNSSSKSAPTHHVVGNGAKNVTLIEYGDYQCPVCEVYYRPLKQVSAQLSNNIYFQFRNLPLSAIHPNAFAAARAAEAAGLQGADKYWAMHDALYDNQSQWSTSSSPRPFFDKYAKSIGLDTAKFDADYASSTVNDAINADLTAFDKTGQQKATPAFFLDGKFIDNSQLVDSSGQPSVAKITALINAEIAKKSTQ